MKHERQRDSVMKTEHSVLVACIEDNRMTIVPLYLIKIELEKCMTKLIKYNYLKFSKVLPLTILCTYASIISVAYICIFSIVSGLDF